MCHYNENVRVTKVINISIMDIEIIMHVPKHAILIEHLQLNEKQYALLFYTYSGYALVIWPALFSLQSTYLTSQLLAALSRILDFKRTACWAGFCVILSEIDIRSEAHFFPLRNCEKWLNHSLEIAAQKWDWKCKMVKEEGNWSDIPAGAQLDGSIPWTACVHFSFR